MPLLAPIALTLVHSPPVIATASTVHQTPVELSLFRNSMQLFLQLILLSTKFRPYIKPTQYNAPCIMRFV
jgi:hypothetical protein